jgi:hypothetical protein
MSNRLTMAQLCLGPVQDLGALSPNSPPPFSFEKDCGLIPPQALPPTYINPKLDTGTYWQGPSVGQP